MISAKSLVNASTLPMGLGHSVPNTFPTSGSSAATKTTPFSVRIAVVGDVHDDWSLEEDTKALQLLKPDLVLFTGDFGNENVDLVRSVAEVDFTKAVILGNHDAWSTRKFSARERDPVQLQLECLGDEHVGYRCINFPAIKLSVVGGRPFSHGGSGLHARGLLKAKNVVIEYNVNDMDGSAKRIYNAALKTPEDHSVVLLAHNGPTGLGSNMDDICGRDWVYGGGDHGDPDLEAAISRLRETTKQLVPLVVFGHMHKQLADGTGLRKMLVVGGDDTVYLNGAVVPRVKRRRNEHESSVPASELPGTLRAFTMAEMLDGRVVRVAETWVSVSGENVGLEEEHVLFSRG